jgi:hypothetical protein
MDQLSLRDALSQYYARHGLPADGGESSRWFHVRLGKFSIPVPNPPARRRAVFFHDANHVLTGYNTTFSEGEMDIAAFEIGAGCGPYLIAWFINGFMMLLGIVTRPRNAMQAFMRGRKSGSIYSSGRTRENLLSMSVASLRQELRIAPYQ